MRRSERIKRQRYLTTLKLVLLSSIMLLVGATIAVVVSNMKRERVLEPQMREAMELLQTDKIASTEYGDVIADEDIHYYFTEDEFKPVNGEIETEEFKYLIGERVA